MLIIRLRILRNERPPASGGLSFVNFLQPNLPIDTRPNETGEIPAKEGWGGGFSPKKRAPLMGRTHDIHDAEYNGGTSDASDFIEPVHASRGGNISAFAILHYTIFLVSRYWRHQYLPSPKKEENYILIIHIYIYIYILKLYKRWIIVKNTTFRILNST